MKLKLSLVAIAAITTLSFTGCEDSTDESNDSNTTVSESNSRLFLQKLSDTSVTIKWRGESTYALLGTDENNLSTKITATITDGDHKEARFTGLSADTKYYYSLGTNGASSTQTFKTAPSSSAYPSDDNNVRIWVVGDSGTAGYLHTDADADSDHDSHHDDYEGLAEGVRDGMEAFTKADGEEIDMFLMLGDNAYNNGDDANYQGAVFETYPEQLKKVAVWPTIGNHEMGVVSYYGNFYGGVSTSSNPNEYYIDGKAATNSITQTLPYLSIFSLPKSGESGGYSSGTEQYYSFDYGKVHVISLDSQLTARDDTQRAAMKSWLESDLQNATSADWKIVIFHHPVYSKGANHDTDHDARSISSIDKPIINMRNDFVPLFQQYGIDLVLNGHSHSYERSYYLKDLYAADGNFSSSAGDSDEFNASVNAYGGTQLLKTDYNETDGYVVYTTAGNGGKADGSASGLNLSSEWLNHNAMVEQNYTLVSAQVDQNYTENNVTFTKSHTNGLAIPGSVLIDANASRLKVRMLNKSAETLDTYIINK